MQYDYPTCESIGLLKVDFLGLSTLTVLRRTADLIKKRHGIEYNLSNIPLEDPEAFKLMGKGECTGLFQIDGQGMRKFLRQMKPNKFEHIVAMLALYRPGPMQYIPNYIARMHGEEEVEYRHPALEPILSFTYGIIVYQESIMRIATDLCGYSGQEADYMRSAVSKKKEKEIAHHRDLMIAGATKNGIPEETMGLIYDDIEKFASYGFNQAHASDYAMVTCATAFMKTHYAPEFMTALLSVEHNNQDKIGILLTECRKLRFRS